MRSFFFSSFAGLLALSTTLASSNASADVEETQAAPPPAPAEALPSAWEIGLRAGYGRALSSTTTNSLSQGTPFMLPLKLDAGYRYGHVFAGIYGQMAITARSDCGDSSGCSAKDYQLGFNVHYHVRPMRTVDPWFGAGVGYETLHLTSTNITYDRAGVDFLILQAGTDFQLGADDGRLRPHLGPFMDLALGKMEDSTFVTPAHQWLTIGVRGTIDL